MWRKREMETYRSTSALNKVCDCVAAVVDVATWE